MDTKRIGDLLKTHPRSALKALLGLAEEGFGPAAAGFSPSAIDMMLDRSDTFESQKACGDIGSLILEGDLDPEGVWLEGWIRWASSRRSPQASPLRAMIRGLDINAPLPDPLSRSLKDWIESGAVFLSDSDLSFLISENGIPSAFSGPKGLSIAGLFLATGQGADEGAVLALAQSGLLRPSIESIPEAESRFDIAERIFQSLCRQKSLNEVSDPKLWTSAFEDTAAILASSPAPLPIDALCSALEAEAYETFASLAIRGGRISPSDPGLKTGIFVDSRVWAGIDREFGGLDLPAAEVIDLFSAARNLAEERITNPSWSPGWEAKAIAAIQARGFPESDGIGRRIIELGRDRPGAPSRAQRLLEIEALTEKLRMSWSISAPNPGPKSSPRL